MKEIEIVICESSHGTYERKKLYEELKNADLFVPEFFGSSILETEIYSLDVPSILPAKRIKEAYEQAKKENKKLDVLTDKDSENFFLSQFGKVDEAEGNIRKTLYSMAFGLITKGEARAYEEYKAELPKLFEEIAECVKINKNLEDKFCELLTDKLKKYLKKQKESEKLKIVIDSGFIHQYSSLRPLLEKETGAKINLRKEVEKETIIGFVEDLIIKTAKGELNEKNIDHYRKEIAQGVLFEAVYSPYRMEINSPLGIDREKQEKIYKKYLPKVKKWGEKDLKKFWKSLYNHPELLPFVREEDMKEILKEAGLED